LLKFTFETVLLATSKQHRGINYKLSQQPKLKSKPVPRVFHSPSPPPTTPFLPQGQANIGCPCFRPIVKSPPNQAATRQTHRTFKGPSTLVTEHRTVTKVFFTMFCYGLPARTEHRNISCLTAQYPASVPSSLREPERCLCS
jgi:hypothetical protein